MGMIPAKDKRHGMGGLIMRLADLTVKLLETWGVQFVFGVVGDANLHLLDALSRSKIRFIAARHESCAGFMASAYSKATGYSKATSSLGICTATSGPGTANMVNGLGDAFMDRVPVLAITGQVPSRFIGKRHKQAINQQALMNPVSVFTELVVDPSSAPGVLERAARMAVARGGPAHVCIPYDFWEADLSTDAIPFLPLTGYPHAPAADMEVVSKAAALITSCVRPFILAGCGARMCSRELLALASKIGAAVAYTLPANGIFGADSGADSNSIMTAEDAMAHDNRSMTSKRHPMVVGGLGAAGSEASSNLIKRADLIIRGGTTWWPEGFVPKTPEAVIDINLSEEYLASVGKKYLALVGDAAEIIPALGSLLADKYADKSWLSEIAEEKRSWDGRLANERSVERSPGAEERPTEKKPEESEGATSGAGDISHPRKVHPADIVRALQCLTPDTIITLDSGDQTVWFNRHFISSGQQVVTPGYWRSLGFAVPAAVAAKCAFPDRPVLAYTGDAGLDMCLAEIPAAIQTGTPITIVVANNHTMAIERNRMLREGLVPEGVNRLAPHSSYASFAELCGGKGYYVDDPAKVEAAIASAVKSEKLTVIEVETAAVTVETSKL